MIEKHIVLEDIDPVMFYGVNNAHLQMIKSLYPKLRIVARDNVIRVLGDEEEMAKVEEDIEQMRKHLLKYNMLNDEDILDIVKGKQTKADSVKGVLVYSISGRPIKSRSENQQQLIDAYEKNDMIFAVGPAKCNRLQSLPYQITMILNNLPSGYFRDMQLIKEAFLPAFDELKSILNMVNAMLSEIKVNTDVAQDDRYKFMFSVEEVNRLTREGMPFRDAYKKVGLDIEAGRFEPVKEVHHTHEGSIGNLCNDRIEALFAETLKAFRFDEYHRAIDALLK